MTRELTATDPSPIHRGELDLLARQMAASYADMVEFYEREYKLSHAKAKKKASEHTDIYWNNVESQPANQVSFYTLQSFHDRAPEDAIKKWSEIKREAADELASGMRSAQVTRWESPFEQAQYLALRQSFIDEWQPRGGIEMSLIEQLAHCYSGWMYWLADFDRLRQREANRRELKDEKRLAEWNRTYLPPRVSEAEYVERSLKMADRFQRMFMRTLRALRDLRRYAPKITINNQGQVNIGENQLNQASRQP